MADGGRQDVLGQKAQAAQRAFEARGMSPGKALRRGLSRAADVLWDLALVGQSVQMETLDQDGVIDGINETSLLLLMDGPEGALGLAVFEPEVVTGVVEVQTIQQVTSMPLDERPFSATDAAMMAPLIDNGLERFVAYLDGNPLQPQLDGYRFGAMLEDKRAAGLLLEASQYRAFHVDLDLALGRRRGKVSFVFPDRDVAAAGNAEGEAQKPGPHEAEMLRVPARLDCVLAKVTIPLREAEQLRPGALLPLDPGAMDAAELRGPQGFLAARGRLGQLNGMRALRVTWPKTARPDVEAALALPVAAPDADAGFAMEAEAEMPLSPMSDIGGDLPDFGGMDGAEMDFSADLGGDMAEPAAEDPAPMDFAAEAAAFDLDDLGGDFDAGVDMGANVDEAFASEASGEDDSGSDGGFAAATMDFDIDS